MDELSGCPECDVQFYAGLNEVFSFCLGSSAEGWSVAETTVFDAPTESGIYFINPNFSVVEACLDDIATEAVLMDATIGHLFVTGE